MTLRKARMRRAFEGILHGLLLLFMIAGPAAADQWSRTFGGGDDDFGYSAQQTMDSGYIVLAATTSYGETGGKANLWALKLDTLGSVSWQRAFRGTAAGDYSALIETSKGDFVIAGKTSPDVDGNTYGWVARFDKDGIIWQRSYGNQQETPPPETPGVFEGEFRSIRETADGGFVLVGKPLFPGFREEEGCVDPQG